jgi:hypothetical protein
MPLPALRWLSGDQPRASVFDGPANDVGSAALTADGVIAMGTACCLPAGAVYVRERGRAWSRTTLGEVGDAPRVLFDGRGRLLVVGWRRSQGRDLLFRRERDAAGHWSPSVRIAVAIDHPDGGRADPGLAVDGSGRAIVTWRVGTVQRAVVRNASGRWGAALRLGEAAATPAFREGGGASAKAAFGADGTGWVAWEGGRDRVAVARLPAGARRFARPRLLGPRGSHRPALAATARGAVVAWVGKPTIDDLFDSGRLVESAPVFATALSSVDSGGRPTRISNRRTGSSEPFVVASPAGEATVVWQPDEGNSARYAVLRGTRFEPVRVLAGVRVEFSFAELSPLAIAGDGTAVLLASGPEGSTLYARRVGSGFRVLRRNPAQDAFSDADGAGLAVAGKRIMLVAQRAGNPDSIDPSGEAVIVLFG